MGGVPYARLVHPNLPRDEGLHMRRVQFIRRNEAAGSRRAILACRLLRSGSQHRRFTLRRARLGRWEKPRTWHSQELKESW